VDVVLIGGSVLGTAEDSHALILVVDDDHGVRGALDAALSAEGYDVVSVPDAAAGLEAAATFSVALILLDITMPGMDGSEFVRAYARTPGPHAPTVVLSAAGDGRALARMLGAQDYLGKPFELDDLLLVVSRYAGAPVRLD
jgi:DNA-binding response OmpR family regulator